MVGTHVVFTPPPEEDLVVPIVCLELAGASVVLRDDFAPGSDVELLVSKGPDLIEVPDVIGMRFSDAYDTLAQAGFAVADEGEGNRVVGTDPEGGSMVRRGSTVTIQRRR